MEDNVEPFGLMELSGISFRKSVTYGKIKTGKMNVFFHLSGLVPGAGVEPARV